MKLKGNSGNSKSTKIKVPKIEINECKGKTKDQKKLENEMIQQAKEAQLLLEQLLCEGRCYFRIFCIHYFVFNLKVCVIFLKISSNFLNYFICLIFNAIDLVAIG